MTEATPSSPAGTTAIPPAPLTTPIAQQHPLIQRVLLSSSNMMPSADSIKHKRIQKQLQSLLTDLQKNEPLDPSYDALLPVSIRKHIKSTYTANKNASASDAAKSSSKKSSNVLTADVKLHRRLHAHLRSTVETYASTPAGWRRSPPTREIVLDFGGSSTSNANTTTTTATASANDEELESKLRAAFALRESKEHEQRDLVNATLKAESAKLRRGWGLSQVTGGMGAGAAVGVGGAPLMGPLPPMEEASVRKKRLDGVAKQLREVEKGAAERAKLRKIAERGRDMIFNPNTKLTSLVPRSSPDSSSKNANTATSLIANNNNNNDVNNTPGIKRKRQDSEVDNTENTKLIEQAKKRERVLRERLAREESENARRLEQEREEKERRERAIETPRDALHRIYEPIFNACWDFEFAILGGSNPFRMVIDASNCAQLDAADYCDIIKKPMNLTYIQTKVNNKSYETLQEFLDDVELIVTNCLKYNHHPENPFNVAAKEFKKKFNKLWKPIVKSLTKGQFNAS